MVAPPERLACWTFSTISPPRPTSFADELMVVAAPSIVNDLEVMDSAPPSPLSNDWLNRLLSPDKATNSAALPVLQPSYGHIPTLT